MTHARPRPFRILVLCTGNSARSQIAEALLATRAKGRVKADSAGSRPAARVNAMAIETLREHGIEWEERRPRGIDEVAGQPYDLVITVCDNAREACPFFPGAPAQVHWGLADPAEEVDPVRAHLAFTRTYDEVLRRVDALLALPLEDLAADELRRRAQAIHAAG